MTQNAIWLGDAPGGNYTEKVLKLHAEHDLKPGLYHVLIVHADECGALKDPPTFCSCDPEVGFWDPEKDSGPER